MDLGHSTQNHVEEIYNNFVVNPSPLAHSFFSRENFSDKHKKAIIQKIIEIQAIALEDVPERVARELNIRRDFYEPADAKYHGEHFAHLGKKLIIPGTEEFGRIKMIGGLTTTGSTLFDLAFKLYDRCGMHTEVEPLDGHDGDYYHFRNASNRRWMEQMLDTTKKGDILFPVSTPGAVFAECWARKPGFCAGVVGFGWPIILRNQDNEKLMAKVRRLSAPVTRYNFTNVLKFVTTTYPRSDDGYHKRCPQFTRLPISVAVELSKAMAGAQNALLKPLKPNQKYNFPPVFYAQGELDAPVHPIVRDFMASDFIKSPLKVVPPLYPGAHHMLQMGPSMPHLLRDIGFFMRSLLIYQGHNLDCLPDFQKSIGAVNEIKKTVKTFLY